MLAGCDRTGEPPYTPAVLAAIFAPALLLALLPVQVESTDCPSASEVEQVLAGMLPSSQEEAGRDVARIERVGERLRIELAGADGRGIAERVLEGQGTCTQLAHLAAVVIAAWQSDVHPEFERPQPAVAQAAPPPGAAPAGSYQILLGASLLRASDWAAGGCLAAAWFPRGSGLGMGLFAAGETSRTLQLGAGQARWRRWYGGPEIEWRWGHGRATGDLHGGVALAWLDSNGVDFSQNRSSTGLSLALSMGMRGSWWATRHVAGWIDLRGLYVTRDEMLYSVPASREARVPSLEGSLSIGLSWGRSSALR